MKYLQITETGYTPCGKWRVVPTSLDEGYMMEVMWKTYISMIKSAPTPPAELMLSGEPVGVVVESSILGFVIDLRDNLPKFPTGTLVYLHPAPDAATVRDARRYRALRKHGILLRQESHVFDVVDLDAAADRLLEGE